MRTYIPLNALRAFEAAARHLSISRAADELCVTPTAISHQIKSLEGFLEAPLFERRNGRLALVPATVNALSELSEGFDKLEAALLSLNRRGQRRKLVVAISPSIAALWLMPRLDRFVAQVPGVDLSLLTAISESDFADGAFDVAVGTRAEAPGREMSGADLAFAVSSSSRPSQPMPATTPARSEGEFSPIPAVKTSASSPPRVATRPPSS